MKIVKNILWLSSVILLYTLFGFVFRGNHQWLTLAVLIGVFFLSLLFFKTRKEDFFQGFVFIVFPIVALMILVSLDAGFVRTFLYLVFMPIAFLLAWVLRSKSFLIKSLSILSFSLFVTFLIFPNHRSYIVNRNSKRDLIFPEISLVDRNLNSKQLPNDKIIVLDFWNTACGVCFKKFPEFEKLYLKYKDNPNIEFYSVNMPLKRDKFENVVSQVDKLNYKFPTLYCKTDSKVVEEKLKIDGYPTFLIIKNNRIRFDGFLNIDENIFLYNTVDVVDQLLDEDDLSLK